MLTIKQFIQNSEVKYLENRKKSIQKIRSYATYVGIDTKNFENNFFIHECIFKGMPIYKYLIHIDSDKIELIYYDEYEKSDNNCIVIESIDLNSFNAIYHYFTEKSETNIAYKPYITHKVAKGKMSMYSIYVIKNYILGKNYIFDFFNLENFYYKLNLDDMMVKDLNFISYLESYGKDVNDRELLSDHKEIKTIDFYKKYWRNSGMLKQFTIEQLMESLKDNPNLIIDGDYVIPNDEEIINHHKMYMKHKDALVKRLIKTLNNHNM